MREAIFKVVTDERILLAITSTAFLWRVVVSLDKTEAPWESICSGISLFIMGWALFGYMYSVSRKPTRWPVSNTIYQRIGVSLLVLNSYLIIYYGMRWHELLHVEVCLPLDLIFRDAQYILFVMFYCAIIWSAKYLKKLHEDYRFLLSRSIIREKDMQASVFRVITDDRTLLVLIGIAFLWRTVISFDYTITFWESTSQYIIQLIIGWSLFGYLCALSVKAREKLDLIKVIQGMVLALGAINVYALVYYGMSWYSLVGVEAFVESFVPMDFIFKDVGFFSLVIFYCTTIMISKSLEKAYADYTVPINVQNAN